jgi:hypothetical protein
MKFGNPLFLYGLFALAIPIIIHLYNFRRYKTVVFSDITFLKELTQQTQSKNKLKHLLILSSRLLFIVFLVLAFAQPYIPTKTSGNLSGNLISIYIDNSFSMEAEGSKGRLLDVAKKAAIEICKAYPENDRFQLLTNLFEGKHQRFYTKDDFIQLVEEVKEDATSRKLSEVINQQKHAFELMDASNKKNHIIYILSDFQKTFIGNPKNISKTDSLLKINLIPLQAQESKNIFIDSVWFNQPVLRPQETNLLYVKIKNINSEIADGKPLNLWLNNKPATIATFKLAANSDTTITLPIKIDSAGVVTAQLSIDDYPITYDDKFYFSFTVAKQINIVQVNGSKPNNDLETFFKNDQFFKHTVINQSQIKLSELTKADIIILNEVEQLTVGLFQELNKLINNGISLVIFPAPAYSASDLSILNSLNLNFNNTTDTGNFILENPDYKNPFFQSVFELKKIKRNEKLNLPQIRYKYTLTPSAAGTQRILNFLSGDPFLIKKSIGKGQVYAFASPLKNQYNSLSRHALFVPIMYQISFSSLPNPTLYYIIGENNLRYVKTNTTNTDQTLKLVNPLTQQTFIPQQKIINNQIELFINSSTASEPGNYHIINNENKWIDALSLNYNRNESVVNFATIDEIKQLPFINQAQNNIITATSVDYTHQIKQAAIGKKYWKWCVLAALGALLIESLLIRFYK